VLCCSLTSCHAPHSAQYKQQRFQGWYTGEAGPHLCSAQPRYPCPADAFLTPPP
jgi:hypothetical protein